MDQVRSIDADNNLAVYQSKNDKTRTVSFNGTAMAVINRRLLDRPNDHWLFQSESPKLCKRQDPKPINRRSVGRVFERVGQQLNPPV